MSDATRPPRPGARSVLDSPWVLAAVALVLLGLVAWRSTLGMSFQDDGYYAATTLRLAQGARLFVDEMFLQSLGFLAAVPFAKMWTVLFGTTGIVVALRVFYVALAAVVAVAVYRLLRPSFGPWASLAAAVVPFLAPAYNLFSVTYDTMVAVGLVLASVLAFAALRDSRRALAAAAGAAAAVAAISYPPMAIAAFVLLGTVVVLGGRRPAGAMGLGALAVAGVFTAWLLATTSPPELALAYRFITSSWATMPKTVHGNRILVDLWELGRALGETWGVPVWVWFLPALGLGAWAAIPLGASSRARARARGAALAGLPVALALPAVAERAVHGGAIWTLGGNYLIAFVLFAAPGVFAGLSQRGHDTRSPTGGGARALLLMALPVGVAGALMVVVSSNASIHWASAVVGLAPLAAAVVAVWVEELTVGIGPRSASAAAAGLLVALLLLLFGSTFKDGAPLTLGSTIKTGAYAGLTTNARHAEQVAELQRLGARWVGGGATLMAVELPAAYLLTGGVPLTNVVWLNPGPTDTFTISYLNARRWPDVVLLPLSRADQPALATASDPLLARIARDYTLAERSAVAGVAVYTKRGATPAGP
jgi:hypothetical protein